MLAEGIKKIAENLPQELMQNFIRSALEWEEFKTNFSDENSFSASKIRTILQLGSLIFKIEIHKQDLSEIESKFSIEILNYASKTLFARQNAISNDFESLVSRLGLDFLEMLQRHGMSVQNSEEVFLKF